MNDNDCIDNTVPRAHICTVHGQHLPTAARPTATTPVHPGQHLHAVGGALPARRRLHSPGLPGPCHHESDPGPLHRGLREPASGAVEDHGSVPGFQRVRAALSTSTTVECFKEIRLSKIGHEPETRGRSSASGVAGTLTGQTRIRGAATTPGPARRQCPFGGRRGIPLRRSEVRFSTCSFIEQPERLVSAAAKNLHFQGSRPQSDFIYLPRE